MFRIASRLTPVLMLLSCLRAQPAGAPLTEREKLLLERIEKLEFRLAALETKAAPVSASIAATPVPAPTTEVREAPVTTGLDGTTLNFYVDGYYSWNTNRPVGGVNLLRAYDATSNNFSLNQAGMIVERAARPDAGRRWGYRLDLMYGQATETLQGGAQNEPRPQAYRALFQAYGTYVVPIGSGLTSDFGKWASSLGYEGNYTKDQINYSRGYFFNFLPYYHTGFRTSYAVNDRLSLGYWLVNGANQAEDFNGFKSQLAQVAVKPAKSLAWTIQYYAGQEQRAMEPALNPGLPTTASQPGLSITPNGLSQDGRFHAIDTYISWTPHSRLTLAGELDYVINRVQQNSAPQRVTGGAAYARYQLTPRAYFGQRYTRLSDNGGLFSGVSQDLNEVTSTFGFKPVQGFEVIGEYRRDFSNVPYFLTSDPGRNKKDQNTITIGLLWWFGGKEGSW